MTTLISLLAREINWLETAIRVCKATNLAALPTR
jgi:hypothetical protein